MKKILLIIFALFATNTFSQEIQPFTSDGCSSFPDGTNEDNNLWLDCCRAHDLAYWKGGTFSERLQADEDLQKCVSNLGETSISIIMLVGVRLGGSPFWPTTYRWGYGWDYPRFYRPLSKHELQQIENVTSTGTKDFYTPYQ